MGQPKPKSRVVAVELDVERADVPRARLLHLEHALGAVDSDPRHDQLHHWDLFGGRQRATPSRSTKTSRRGATGRTGFLRIYEGSPRQDFEEVFRSIGAFLDQRRMTEVLLVEAPDGFIVQGIVVSGAGGGTWSDSIGTQSKETLTFLDDDIARFMEEALIRRGRGESWWSNRTTRCSAPRSPRGRRASTASWWSRAFRPPPPLQIPAGMGVRR